MNLTTEQIMQMQSGPEMNAAVAEMVMGWQWVLMDGKRYLANPECQNPRATGAEEVWGGNNPFLLDYSGDIACAFKMQAEIARRNLWEEYVRQLVLLLTDAEHAAKTIWYADENDWWAVANASTLNRCKAALIVMAGRQDAARERQQ